MAWLAVGLSKYLMDVKTKLSQSSLGVFFLAKLQPLFG
jgi:hypothetical protein